MPHPPLPNPTRQESIPTTHQHLTPILQQRQQLTHNPQNIVALPYRTKESPWAETPLPHTQTMEEGPQLTPVGEKSLPAKCKPRALAYCPSMDLIALATEDDELRVFRLNGQRVFGGCFRGDPYLGEREEDGEVRAVVWKGNGEFVFVSQMQESCYDHRMMEWS